jgi:cobalamin biosynthesis protein CobW
LVPAVIVSGFLGSGKTTLVRHLLADAQRRGERVAVISNEFGELAIDKTLIGEGGEAYVELEGGCVCCQLSDELIDTLELLRERVRPDRVVIETSGVALPYDTQLNLYREPVSHWIGDDLAIVVVNAEQLLERRDLEGTFEDQVTSADLLLLNKVDLVPASKLAELEALLRELEPDAPVLRAVQAAVDPLLLFPPEADDLQPLQGRGAARRADRGVPERHAHEQFEAEEIDVSSGIDPAALASQVESLGALRVKGYVETSEGPRLVQGVGRRVSLSEVEMPPRAELLGRLVVIRRAG